MLQPGWSDSQISGIYMCDEIVLQLVFDFQKHSQSNLQHFLQCWKLQRGLYFKC